MTAVSNTSPLRYLILARYADILSGRKAAGVVNDSANRHPPDAELMAAPIAVSGKLSNWLRNNRDLLIMDEWKGRAIIRRQGLPLNGAPGVLGDAYQRGLNR
jgi:hypothetical protein